MSRSTRVLSGRAAAPDQVMPGFLSPPTPPGAFSGAGAAPAPTRGNMVTYRALHEHGGELLATVLGQGSKRGLDIDVHIPGCTEPLTLTNIAFYPEDQCPRGCCYQRGA